MLEVKRIALLEEDGKLATLRAKPKTVLAAEGVDVRPEFAGRDEVVVDPAVARGLVAAHGAGHHPPLVGRHDRHLRLPLPLAKRDNLDMFLEEGDVFWECHFFF